MTPIPASHADHDPLAIAAHAAGDATGSELDDALALVAACPDCASLHHDLRAIAAALPALPVPVRTRDFRLTPEQAASLRPAGWRRLLAPLAGPRFAFAGPLGTGLATLGIAGFLVAGAVGMPLAGSAAGPGDTAAGSAAGPGVSESGDPMAAMQAPSDAPLAATEAPAASVGIEMVPASGAPAGEDPVAYGNGGAGTGGGGPIDPAQADPKAEDEQVRMTLVAPGEDEASAQAMDATVQAAPATATLFVLASVMLVVGVLLGGLRLAARRAA